MTATSLGPFEWGVSQDKDGHRDYTVRSKVQTTDYNDGPGIVMNAAGLPVIGSPWNFGNDFDPWALCWPTIEVEPIITDGDHVYHWIVTNKFSTKPLNRCQNQSIQNPLLEPQKVSGAFTAYTKEAEQDKDGNPILSSSHEKIYGIDQLDNRASVVIEQNVAGLGLNVFSQMINTVNDNPIWGMPARHVMLTNCAWSRKLWGTCTFYYTRRFEFEVRKDGFDLDDVADMGFKQFNGIDPNDPGRADPSNYVVIKDPNDENTPVRLMLDGNGDVNSDPINNPTFLPTIQLYGESNFFTLGVPAVF